MNLQPSFLKTASRQNSARRACASRGNRSQVRAASRVLGGGRRNRVGTTCYADQLGTPRAITRPSDNALLWKWENSDPFGNNAPNEDPSSLGVTTKYNLRLPGQYADAETGTYYNYFRDYDPSIGRYIESDPIGLKAGLSTYAYVSSTPLKYIDPNGLEGSSYMACDGKGNWKVFNNDNTCTRPCTQAHEEAHRQDYTKKYGAGACANIREKQMPPGMAGTSPSEPLDAQYFYARSQCRAMKVELKCLRELPCDCAGKEPGIKNLELWMGPKKFDCAKRADP